MLELVGVRYLEKGLDPNVGLDCYGVVRFILNAELNMDLPAQVPSASVWSNYVTIYRKPLPPLQMYDVVMFADLLPDLANHIGIMINGHDFIHAGSRYGGVVCSPLSHFEPFMMGRPRCE